MRIKTRLLPLFIACFVTVSASSSEPAIQLPQAKPGSLYAVQLTIPSGLGYPFQECHLTGDALPKTLFFDCERLRLKGRIPSGLERTYRVTLSVSDAQGNNKTFGLVLKVSSKPEFVDLGGPQIAMKAKEAPQATIADIDHRSDVEVSRKDLTPSASPDNWSASSGLRYTPISATETSEDASNLQAAARQLTQPSVSIVPVKMSAKSHSVVSRLKGHAFFNSINLTCDPVPDENNAVAADRVAQSDLKNNILACAHPSKTATEGGCAQYQASLSKIQDEAEEASSNLKACAALDSSLNKIAKLWYLARAAAWDALVADMNARQDAVNQKTYLPAADLAQPITGDPLTAAVTEGSQKPQNPWVKEQVGVGSRVTSPNSADYSNNSNVLSKNGIGMQTPAFLLGASFQMPQFDRHFALHKMQSNHGNRFSGLVPTSIFTNLQFAPNSTNVLNGYTFGFGYRLGNKDSPLDLLLGYALSPFNEPSPGFRVAAAQVVTANSKLANPLPIYLRYDAAKILDFKDWPEELDGFPVLVQNPDGTQGAPIYPGNVLTTHYRGGLFLGLSFSYDLFGQLFQPKQAGSSSAAH
jgi:hypothetical protein